MSRAGRMAESAKAFSRPHGGRLGTVAAFYAALLAFVVVVNRPTTYTADNRFEEYWSPGGRLLRQLFIWDGTRDLGGIREEWWPSSLIVAALRAVGMSPAWAVHLYHALLIGGAGLGVVVLVRCLRGRIDTFAVVAGLLYMFGPFSATFLVPSALYLSFVIAPWVLAAFLRGVRALAPGGDDGAVQGASAVPPAWPTAAAFALLVAFVGTTDPPGLFYVLVLLIPTAVYVVYLERATTWRIVLLWLARAGLLSLLTGAAALTKIAIGAGSYSERLAYTESPRVVNVASSWAEAWRGLGFWLTYFRDEVGMNRPQGAAFLRNPLVIAATFGLPILSVLALARSRWRPRLLFAALIATSLVLVVGAYPIANPSPYGRLLLDVYEKAPWIAGLRTTFKAGSGIALGVAVLVALLATRREGASRAAKTAIPVGIGLVVLVAAFPFWTGRLYSTTATMSELPSYWRSTMRYLDEQPTDGRVLVLPGSTVTPYRWGWPGDDIFDALLRRPHASASALRSSGPVSADLLRALMTRSGPGYEEGTFAPIARRLGIAYVVVRNDIDWERADVPRPSAYDALRGDPDLSLVATFGAPGTNTTSSKDRSLAVFNEAKLPPVEIYEVRSADAPVRVAPDVPPHLLAGSGDAWPGLARRGVLGSDAGVRYTAESTPRELTQALKAGSALTVSDTNRRRLTLLRGTSSTSSQTLAAGEEIERGRRAQQLFPRAGAQSVADFGAARRITASGVETLRGFLPWERPANAFDGDPASTWLTGALSANPVGGRVRVDLKGPRTISEMQFDRAPWAAPGRRISRAEIVFSDGSRRWVAFDKDHERVTFKARRVRWFEVRINGVDGSGLGPVGFSEITVPGTDLREFIRMPDDVARAARRSRPLRTALGTAPVAYQMRREAGQGLVDEERQLRRVFATVGDRTYRAGGDLRLTAAVSDEVVDALLGGPVGAFGSTRSGGLLENRGGLAVDGKPDTGWSAPAKEGERLTVRFPTQPVTTVDVVAAHGGDLFSGVREVAVSVGDQHQRIRLTPVDCGPAGGPVPATCRDEGTATFTGTPASNLAVEVTDVEPLDTVLGPKPVSVLEVRFSGDNAGPPPGDTTPEGCTESVVSVDGAPVPVRVLGDRAALLAGEAVPYEACAEVTLPAGEHRLEAVAGIDSALLESTPVPPLTTDAPAGRATKLERLSPTKARLHVEAAGAVVVTIGEAYDKGWVARLDGRSLGPAVSIDGQAGWRLPSGGVLAVEFRPQRIYTTALAVSLAGVVLCVGLVSRQRRRG